MATLTEKGRQRLGLLAEAERSGKITARGKQVLAELQKVAGILDVPQLNRVPDIRPSTGKRVWEGIRLPEQMLTQILTPEKPMTTLEPHISPSILKTIATGAPRVLERSARDIGKFIKRITPSIPQNQLAQPIEKGEEFVKNMLPSLVSRGAILTAGTLKGLTMAKPIINLIRQGGFNVLEAPSGLRSKQAGILEEAFQDPTLFLSRGKKAAGKLYETAKVSVKDAIEETQKLIKPKRAVKIVSDSIAEANAGTLTPINALKARKATDILIGSKTFVKDEIIPLRNAFNTIAKTDKNIAKADKIVERGIKASALRTLFPTNVGGSFSSWKTLAGAGAMTLPGGKVLAPLFLSPAIQGAIASGMGMAAKGIQPALRNPVLTAQIASLITKVLSEKKAKEYLRKAKQKESDEERARILARQMALNDKWEIPD